MLDVSADTALLKLGADSGRRPISHAPSQSVSVGDPIYVIGDPLGLTSTLSTGVIGALRNDEGVPLVQITAPISHGSSGGPVLDALGRAIGIVSYTFTEGQNLNMAVGTKVAKSLMASKNVYSPSDLQTLWAKADEFAKSEAKGSEGAPNSKPEPSSASAKVQITQGLARIFSDLTLAHGYWLASFTAALDDNHASADLRLEGAKRRFDDAIDLDELGRVIKLAKESGVEQKPLLDLFEQSSILFKLSYERLAAEKQAFASGTLSEAETRQLVEVSASQQSRCWSAIKDLSKAIFAVGVDDEAFLRLATGSGVLAILDPFRCCPDLDFTESLMLLPTSLESPVKSGDHLLAVAVHEGGFFETKDWDSVNNFLWDQKSRGYEGRYKLKVRRLGQDMILEDQGVPPEPKNDQTSKHNYPYSGKLLFVGVIADTSRNSSLVGATAPNLSIKPGWWINGVRLITQNKYVPVLSWGDIERFIASNPDAHAVVVEGITNKGDSFTSFLDVVRS